MTGTLGFSALGAGLGYDFSVYGPNGFLRTFAGSLEGAVKHQLETGVSYDGERNSVTLMVTNKGNEACSVSVLNGYTKGVTSAMVGAGEELGVAGGVGEDVWVVRPDGDVGGGCGVPTAGGGASGDREG